MVAGQQTVQTVPLTVGDYERMTADTDTRYELIDGVLIEMPSPTVFHQRILQRYFRLLDDYVEERHLGEVFIAPLDVELSPYDVVQPDLIVVATRNADVITGKRIVGAPDLAVEISSPGTTVRDRIRKRRLYEQAGVREYWFADTFAQTQTTWALEGRHYVEIPAPEGQSRSVLLAELEIDVAAVIAAANR